MDTKRRRVFLLLCLGLISYCERVDGKGLCDFEEKFPPQGKETCYKDDDFIEDEVSPCPLNMVWGNCTCLSTCEDPEAKISCHYSSCSGDEGCYCPSGFLMEREHCIPLNECGCFLPEAEEVLSFNVSYVSPDCSRRCVCRNDDLVCEEHYPCSPYALCETRNNVRTCYCKDGFFGDGQTCSLVGATDCYDMFNAGFNNSGVYTIQPINLLYEMLPFEVYCNMEDEGGWTVIQRRIDGAVDFYLGWEDYSQGFGSLQHGFWLGNDKIASLTNQRDYQLRIDFVNSLGTPYYATYSLFRVGDKAANYRLDAVGQYSGNAGQDALGYHRGQMFSTYDRDNDASASYNCAERYHGAWWYSQCYHSNLNGGYFESSTSGIYWTGLSGVNHIAYTEMKIRPTGT